MTHLNPGCKGGFCWTGWSQALSVCRDFTSRVRKRASGSFRCCGKIHCVRLEALRALQGLPTARPLPSALQTPPALPAPPLPGPLEQVEDPHLTELETGLCRDSSESPTQKVTELVLESTTGLSFCHTVVGVFRFLNKKVISRYATCGKTRDGGFSLSLVFPLFLCKIKTLTPGLPSHRKFALWMLRPFQT